MALCFILLNEICDSIIKAINFKKEIGDQVETGEEKKLQNT